MLDVSADLNVSTWPACPGRATEIGKFANSPGRSPAEVAFRRPRPAVDWRSWSARLGELGRQHLRGPARRRLGGDLDEARRELHLEPGRLRVVKLVGHPDVERHVGARGHGVGMHADVGRRRRRPTRAPRNNRRKHGDRGGRIEHMALHRDAPCLDRCADTTCSGGAQRAPAVMPRRTTGQRVADEELVALYEPRRRPDDDTNGGAPTRAAARTTHKRRLGRVAPGQ